LKHLYNWSGSCEKFIILAGKEAVVSSFDQAATQFIYRWKKLITAINNLYNTLQEMDLL
jgi:hypothetical protein